MELFTQAGATQAAAAVVLEAADSALAICRRHFRPTDRFSVELRSPLGPLAIDDDPDLIVDYIHLLLRRSGVNRPAYPEGYGHEDSLGELARSVSMAMAVSDG
ncbi:MAG: hypothetical protein IPM64_03015 [Phycisphaerales bacterium]|nr:hypothetical protein [Phycisphaerales bacterium]